MSESNTCIYTKSDRQQCKRPAEDGELYCWQHAGVCKRLWKRVTRNPAVSFVVALLGLAGTGIALFLTIPPLIDWWDLHYSVPTGEVMSSRLRSNTELLARRNLRSVMPRTPIKSPPTSPVSKNCHLSNHELLDCSNADVLRWGTPVLERLQEAVDKNLTQRKERAEMGWPDQSSEIIDLNRYLDGDFANLLTYKNAVASRLTGGLSAGECLALDSFEMDYKRMPGLSDKYSNLSRTRTMLYELRELTERFSEQVDTELSVKAPKTGRVSH